jgi:L-histidine N-alpha-methyltransferase
MTTRTARIDVHLTPDDARAALRADVRLGLTARPRTLPPKYFYDARGSALFEEITACPSTTRRAPRRRCSPPTSTRSPA